MKLSQTFFSLFILVMSHLVSTAWAQGQVTGFTLINSADNTAIRAINSGDTIDLATDGTQLNMRADTSGIIGSVKFELDGAVTRTENVFPYALGGDSSGDYNNFTDLASIGPHTVAATPYAESGGSGAAGVKFTIDVTVIDSNVPQVTGFTLINAATNTAIRAINSGDTINLANDGTQLNIRADTAGSVGSVKLELDGVVTRTESWVPYALGGDSSGDYNDFPDLAVVGPHTVAATPYAESGGSGAAYAKLTIDIQVVEASTRRYDWSDNPLVNQEADQASEEVRADWTEALASYDFSAPYFDLEKIQLYNEWKVEASEIVKNNPNTAHFKLYKNLSPAIGFFNTFAKRNACHPSDIDYAIDQVWHLLEGHMKANGFGGDDSCGATAVRGRRQLGGGCSCGGCGGGYTCCWRCNRRRRRRLQDAEGELDVEEANPDKYEKMARSLVSNLISQCEVIVHNIGTFAKDLTPECREALTSAKCDVRIDVWDAISLVVDGVEKLAADMIEEKFLENTS